MPPATAQDAKAQAAAQELTDAINEAVDNQKSNGQLSPALAAAEAKASATAPPAGSGMMSSLYDSKDDREKRNIYTFNNESKNLEAMIRKANTRRQFQPTAILDPT